MCSGSSAAVVGGGWCIASGSLNGLLSHILRFLIVCNLFEGVRLVLLLHRFGYDLPPIYESVNVVCGCYDSVSAGLNPIYFPCRLGWVGYYLVLACDLFQEPEVIGEGHDHGTN